MSAIGFVYAAWAELWLCWLLFSIVVLYSQIRLWTGAWING